MLWQDPHKQYLLRLEALRRDTGWVGVKNPPRRLIRYVTGCAGLFNNYQPRHATKRPISSAGVESAADHLVGNG